MGGPLFVSQSEYSVSCQRIQTGNILHEMKNVTYAAASL